MLLLVFSGLFISLPMHAAALLPLASRLLLAHVYKEQSLRFTCGPLLLFFCRWRGRSASPTLQCASTCCPGRSR